MSPTSRRYRRTACTGLALVLPLAALAACGGNGGSGGTSADAGSGKGTISVWAHQGQKSEDGALQSAVKSFNSSQSKIKVELKLIPGNDYTKTITATDASQLPDVMEFDGPTMANFVYNKKLAAIDSYVSAKTMSNATAGSKAQGEIDGKHYGLGMYDSGLGVYGNRKLLDAAGVKYPTGLSDDWTADQFTAALKALKAKDSDGKTLDLEENNGYATEWGTYGFALIVWSAAWFAAEGRQGRGRARHAYRGLGHEDLPVLEDLRRPQHRRQRLRQGPRRAELGRPLDVPHLQQGPRQRPRRPSPARLRQRPQDGPGIVGLGHRRRHQERQGGRRLPRLPHERHRRHRHDDGQRRPARDEDGARRQPLYKQGGPLRLFADQLAKPCGDSDITKSCVAVTRPVTAGYPTVTAKFSDALNSIYGGADPKSALEKAARAIDQDFSDNAGYKIP